MATDVGTPWRLTGTVLVSCNCDYGCPCNFNALPTKGNCEGGWTWHIEDGRFGDVALTGLSFGLYVKWPGAIHHGNGEGVFFVDERADAHQQDAIASLVKRWLRRAVGSARLDVADTARAQACAL